MRQWNIETGYDHDTNGNEYPLRSFSFGHDAGLKALFKIDPSNLEYICHGSGLGYTVTLSAPGELYGESRPSIRVPLLEDSWIAVKPKVITTSEGLRSYTPNQRQCYYSSERRLRFFKIYTQNNCEAECLANFTSLECGCVKFHMPSEFSMYSIQSIFSVTERR